ncbi:hypothetical protein EOD41_16775 [Mucilaginibacter limnophilus]|uniref:Lantibiotic dehydratase n=1 Tax=Mucilaginibacter limnophilus TaxID=1932778 RepID=A0A437MLA8_9SPHI|nr:lantibiotic dehydratase [Mucilaginibacter limnophilus]RVT98444.1 hypothetical protein EOD41_16775 [Mucilaginibacter limnophilus]
MGTSGFSVLFRTNGDQLWIEAAGGYHTNSLPGRFTPASEAIETAAVAMAAHEQALNPDVLFAELVHLSDLHTDNVNRRSVILPFEIPIIAASTVPKSRQLALADLFVTVSGGRVLLTSRSHGKIVLPRLSSAYNHGLNDLPLFRFLADIPYQFSSPVQTLDLRQLFPGLDFYPRVVFRQAVLAPARWILTESIIKSLAMKNSEGETIKNFRSFSQRLGLPVIFAWAQGDQQLIFNAQREADILFFIACLGRSKVAELQEVLLDSGNKPGSHPVVTVQYNAFIEASRPLSLPYPEIPGKASTRNKRRFMPGSEWLYLKIYTTRLATDALLRQLAPYLKKRSREDIIRKWFFVRYEDHAPHIRLRLLVAPADLGQVMADMRRLFETKVERQLIREFQVDTYARELERYGITPFEEVEQFFWSSSKLVLKYLTGRKNLSASPLYIFALAITRTLVAAAFENEEQQATYCFGRYQQLSQEFEGDKIHVELDKKFRSLRAPLNDTLSDASFFRRLRLAGLNATCVADFRTLIQQVSLNSAVYEDLVGSLIHMHLNRLFTTESRKQEMIVFYLLFKYTRSQAYKGKGLNQPG